MNNNKKNNTGSDQGDQEPPQRYTLIDCESLRQLCGIPSNDQLILSHKQWVEETLECYIPPEREPAWSEIIAVGSPIFLERIKGKLRKLNNRQVVKSGGVHTLREPDMAYSSLFDTEKASLSLENTYFWDE